MKNFIFQKFQWRDTVHHEPDPIPLQTLSSSPPPSPSLNEQYRSLYFQHDHVPSLQVSAQSGRQSLQHPPVPQYQSDQELRRFSNCIKIMRGTLCLLVVAIVFAIVVTEVVDHERIKTLTDKMKNIYKHNITGYLASQV